MSNTEEWFDFNFSYFS